VRTLIALLAALLLWVWAGACGGSVRHTAAGVPASSLARASSEASATANGGESHNGQDNDNDDSGPFAGDDNNSSVREFGHSATPSDVRAIAALLKRYYATTFANDGAHACSMVMASFVKAVPLDYGVFGARYLRGSKTCAAVLTRMFAHEHSRLVAEAPYLAVLDVRLQGKGALVLLGFGERHPEREITVGREGSSWKMSALLDGELP
jgi:hypothetical protein